MKVKNNMRVYAQMFFSLLQCFMAWQFIAQGSLAHAQVASQTQVFPADGWGFGNAMASSGTTLAVGDDQWIAPRVASPVGAVYLYTQQTAQWKLTAQISPADGKPYDRFGACVALSGTTLVVGAPRHSRTGAVYVYTQNSTGWSLQQEIVPADGKAYDMFGSAVSVSGTTLVVGASGKNKNAGGVYTYALANGKWTQNALLISPDPAPANAKFGFSLVVSANLLWIGAPGQKSASGVVAGVAYAYLLSTTGWQKTATFVPSDLQAGGQFGYTLAYANAVLAIGAPGARSVVYTYVIASNGAGGSLGQLAPFEGTGMVGFGRSLAVFGTKLVVGTVGNVPSDQPAYLFTLASGHWISSAQLWPGDDTGENAQFGAAVALVGNAIIVSHPLNWAYAGASYVAMGEFHTFVLGGAESAAPAGKVNDAYGSAMAANTANVFVGAPGRSKAAGGVYQYQRGTNGALTYKQALLAPAGTPGANYGATLAATDTLLAVGAPGAKGGAGAVYVYTPGVKSWTLAATLAPDSLQPGDSFGFSMALTANTLVVGAPGSDGNTGTVYIYTIKGNNVFLTARLAATDGQLEDLFGSSVAIDENNLLIGAPNADSDTAVNAGLAYLYTGSGSAWTPVLRITAPDAANNAQFATSVAVSGSTLAIGGANAGAGYGAVYLYNASNSYAAPRAELQTSAGQGFGDILALSGNTLAVRAPSTDAFVGGIQLFTLTNGQWIPTKVLTPIDGQISDSVGATVILSGVNVLFGSPDSNSGTGTMYLY